MENFNKIQESGPEKNRLELIAKISKLVVEINESGERLPFPGVRPEVYSAINEQDQEFPGYTTPISEIVARCKTEGIKIMTGRHPGSGNVYIVPAESTNVEMDGLTPYQLIADNTTNEQLKELIELTALFKNLAT